MDEAADELRISRRAFQEVVQRHPHYYVNGRRKLFTEADIAAIVNGLRREAAQCQSPSSRHAPEKRQTGRCAAPTSRSSLTELQEGETHMPNIRY